MLLLLRGLLEISWRVSAYQRLETLSQPLRLNESSTKREHYSQAYSSAGMKNSGMVFRKMSRILKKLLFNFQLVNGVSTVLVKICFETLVIGNIITNSYVKFKD